MTARVTALYRHPIKAVGREAVESAMLTEDETFPGDRLWAVAHEASKAEADAWSPCIAFLRAASSPQLMAVEARLDGGTVTLTHPERPEIRLHPDETPEALIDWLRPLVAEGRAAPARVVRAPAGRGMTDSSAASVTLGNAASHRALEQRAGRRLSPHRWRCNIWVEGLAPWEEFDLVGRKLRIGAAEAEVCERIARCEATQANPETGRRDTDMLGLLDEIGHRDFTVGLRVTSSGAVRLGDTVRAA
ncbi:MAG: MOSC domain-containing protein [Paracoccaceae bacterium]